MLRSAIRNKPNGYGRDKSGKGNMIFLQHYEGEDARKEFNKLQINFIE